MTLVTVHRSLNPAEADLVRSRLEAAEFHVVLAHDLAALSLDGYGLAVGGVLVQVPDDEAAGAAELLASSSK